MVRFLKPEDLLLEKIAYIMVAMILVLPWYPVYHLQMPLRQRLIICGIFLTGGFVIASGIAKTVFVVQATKEGPDKSCECCAHVPFAPKSNPTTR